MKHRLANRLRYLATRLDPQGGQTVVFTTRVDQNPKVLAQAIADITNGKINGKLSLDR